MSVGLVPWYMQTDPIVTPHTLNVFWKFNHLMCQNLRSSQVLTNPWHDYPVTNSSTQNPLSILPWLPLLSVFPYCYEGVSSGIGWWALLNKFIIWLISFSTHQWDMLFSKLVKVLSSKVSVYWTRFISGTINQMLTAKSKPLNIHTDKNSLIKL